MSNGRTQEQATERLAYTYHETAQAAHISVAMVRKLAGNGKLKVIKIGRCARIPRDEVLRLCGVQERGNQ